MNANFSPMSIPPQNSLGDQTKNTTKWYRRWYVWVLPLAVVAGAVIIR